MIAMSPGVKICYAAELLRSSLRCLLVSETRRNAGNGETCIAVLIPQYPSDGGQARATQTRVESGSRKSRR
jgi:hypothetical protein